MVLSEILKNLLGDDQYTIVDEKEFDTLGLAASNPGRLFCTFLDDDKWIERISEDAVMVITNEEFPEKIREYFGNSKGICMVDNPREVFFDVHNFLQNSGGYLREKVKTRIGEKCHISPLASIDKENVLIGNNVIIEEFVVIRENTVVGDNTIIRAGAKIGGHGFEFKRTCDAIMSVCHFGGVRIGKNVEIQYNSCIDRAVYPWDDTLIGDFSKIDNLVHIGHAAKIGRNVLIVAHSGIGGRTEIADNAWVGFGATVSNGLNILEKGRINIGSVVTKNVASGQVVSGNFAVDHKVFIQNLKNVCSEVGWAK